MSRGNSPTLFWFPALVAILALQSIPVVADSRQTPYLGQSPPGATPEIFAPDIVTTDRNEHFGPTFSPDGDQIVWSFFTRERGLQIVEREAGIWGDPQGLPFNEPFKEDGPYFSPDGERLYFYSQRPITPGEVKSDWDIWYVERLDDGWSAPVNPGAPLNSADNEIFVAVADDTSLYFCTLGPPRIMYRAQSTEEGYLPPVRMPEVINTDLFYSHPYVAPDESFLIFSSTRPGGEGSADLYLSRRLPDGGWAPPRNLGAAINTPVAERSPCVTPDGKYLFFVRHQLTTEGGGYCCGDVYWVSMTVLLEVER
ncbi:MAG: hypothetical protein GY835_07390 [bacterium]|nr:hypothetical protein [bacterium]